jgi:hypothetical protein
MSVRIRLATIVASACTLVAGLTVGALVESAAAAPAAGQTVQVLVRGDHTIKMPRRVRPGVTELAIRSRRVAGFQLARPTAGYTKREAARDINRAFNQNNMRALRRFENNMTLLGGMPTTREESASVTVRLRRGVYWALDTMPQVLKPRTIRTFRVAGDSVGGKALPGRTLRAIDTSTFGSINRTLPGRGTIRFQNRSDVPHFLAIDKLEAGKTMKDFRAWIDEGSDAPPPVDMDAGIDTSVVSGGQTMSFRYRLPQGRYVLTCWWPMSTGGGTPHALMGMYRGLVIK